MVSVLSNKIARQALKPGDHIYSWRNAYLYAHHGIFAGGDEVIHFTRAAGHETGTGTVLDSLLFSSSPVSLQGHCLRCQELSQFTPSNSSSGGGGVVVSSCLDCFLAGGHLYLFSYSVSRAFFLAKARGGTCTLANSDPPNLVLHRSRYLLTGGFGAYSLFKNNCEDFAIYCKTGLLIKSAFGCSGQLSSITWAVGAVASSPVRLLFVTPAGFVVFTASMYCMGRYFSDIGIRRDVVKVPVEGLELKLEAVTAEEEAEAAQQQSLKVKVKAHS